MLIEVKMPTIVGILTYMSMIIFISVELSIKSFKILSIKGLRWRIVLLAACTGHFKQFQKISVIFKK